MSFHHLNMFSITTLLNVCWVFLIKERRSQHFLVCSFWTTVGKIMKFMVLIHMYVRVVEYPFVCAMKSVLLHAHLTLRRIYFKRCVLLSPCFTREVKTWCFQLSHMVLKFWEGDLKNSHWKVFWERHENTYDVSCQNAFSDNLPYFVDHIWTYHGIRYSWANFGFQQQLTSLTPSWVVNQVASLSQHLTQIDNDTENIMGSISWGNPW